MQKIIIPLVLTLGIVHHPCNAQGQTRDDPSYQLYLTQIAAAEAFLQLNKISTATGYLNACDEQYRDIEWRFLKAALDQSTHTLTGQNGVTFTNVKVGPDGTIVAVSGSDGSIVLYSFPGFEIIRELKGHSSSISTLDFSSDGKRLASGGRDHAVILWDVTTGKQLAKNEGSFSQGIYQVRFSPDNSMLGVVSWERLNERKPYIFGFAKLLNVNDLHEERRIELDNHPASGIVFTPDGHDILIATWGEIAYSYNVQTGNQNWNFDLSDPSGYNAFHSIDISPDGKTLALGSADYRVYLLDVKDGKVLHRIEPWVGHTKIIKAVSFSPDGKWLATGGEDQTILLWNTSDFSRKQSCIGHVNTVSGLAWSNSGTSVFSSSLDGTIKQWDLTRPFETTYKICNFGPWQTPFTSDKKYFAAPCSDKKLILYDASTGNAVSHVGMQSGLCATISKDSKTLFTSSFDGVVRVWDIQTSREVKTLAGHSARVDGIAYVDEKKQILSVGDSTLRIWNVNSEKELNVLRFDSAPFRIVISPDESTAYIGFHDGAVRAFSTGTWEEIGLFKCAEGIQEMALSPDGTLLAAFCGKNIEVWDAKTLKRKALLQGHEKSGYGISFSADNSYIISGSYDQTFKLWNLTTGACTLTYHGYEDIIYSSKFVSANEIFLSSSQGKIWYYRF
ncbi:MAG: WD40 repeat domain-containing protein [Ignavibacteriales bacterium]|nr:WD40 repeat domain-containing protein [Ignavibacteriales bacterium]